MKLKGATHLIGGKPFLRTPADSMGGPMWYQQVPHEWGGTTWQRVDSNFATVLETTQET